MMAAGLPVVDLHMENNLYDMPENAILLAHHTPESIASAIINILDDANKQTQMSEYGQEYMDGKTLEYGYARFLAAVNNILSDSVPITEYSTRKYLSPPVIADAYFALSKGGNAVNENTEKPRGLINKLKHNKILRRSKLVRRLWYFFKRTLWGM